MLTLNLQPLPNYSELDRGRSRAIGLAYPGIGAWH